MAICLDGLNSQYPFARDELLTYFNWLFSTRIAKVYMYVHAQYICIIDWTKIDNLKSGQPSVSNYESYCRIP